MEIVNDDHDSTDEPIRLRKAMREDYWGFFVSACQDPSTGHIAVVDNDEKTLSVFRKDGENFLHMSALINDTQIE